MKEALKPELVISSFNDKDVRDYIEKLDAIQETFGPEQPIVLHIDSYGGSAYGLINLYEYLVASDAKFITYTTSKAMSAGAFLLAMGAKKGYRYASPNSTILVHEMQGGIPDGDIKDIETNVEAIKSINTKILDIFAKTIGKNNAQDVRDFIKKNSIGNDLNLSAQQAKDLGIVDHVCYLKIIPSLVFNVLELRTQNPVDVQKELRSANKSKKTNLKKKK